MSMTIDGTVVVITVVEAGEAVLVETNGEVVGITEEEDIGEVEVKAEEVEDTGEAEDTGEGGEAEEEEDVMQGAVPLLTPLMTTMLTWGNLTWAVKGIRESEDQLMLVTALSSNFNALSVPFSSNFDSGNSRDEGKPSIFERLDKGGSRRPGRGRMGNSAFNRLSGLGGSSSHGTNWHKVTVSPCPWDYYS